MKRFDCIVALEVLEHTPPEMVDSFFSDVLRLLKPGGRVIITVPVMVGPVGFLKILMYLGTLEGYTLTAAFRHLFGAMPKTRFLRDGLYEHEGFDYRALRWRVKREFGKVEQGASPFPSLPAWLNSQAVFVCC